MLTATSFKHPSVKAKIMQATKGAIDYARGTSDAYTSVRYVQVGKHSLFIKANNKGRVVAVECYNDKTGRKVGDVREIIAKSF